MTSTKPQEEGIKLKTMWNGHPEGTEIWDLHPADRRRLVGTNRAEYITRDIPDTAPTVEEAAAPVEEVPGDVARETAEEPPAEASAPLGRRSRNQ